MKHALAVGLLAIAIVACRSGGDKADPGNPEVLRTQAIAAMAEVSSYRTEIDFGEGEPLVTEYVKPDSYRSSFDAGADGMSEALYVGERIYSRQCDASNTGCDPWTSKDRGDVIVGALSLSYFPQWPLVALEMAGELAAPEDDRITGSVNHIRAIFENVRRLSETSSLPFDLDEALQEEDDTAYYDDHPADAHWSIDPATMRLRAVEIAIVDQGGGAPITIAVTYSDFNNVTIEAPR